MKNKSLISLISAATLTLSIVSTSAIAGDNTVKRLKLPVWFGTHLTGLGSSPLFFADTVNKASGGNIKVKIYEPGKLVATKEMLESVSNGSVNAGWGTPGYNTGLLGKKSCNIFSGSIWT